VEAIMVKYRAQLLSSSEDRMKRREERQSGRR
jgi:hypothetical protein